MSKPLFVELFIAAMVCLGSMLAPSLLAAGAPGGAPIGSASAVNVRSFTPSAILLPLSKASGNRKALLRYRIVIPPQHGAVTIPESPQSQDTGVYALYISDRDMTGADSFTWAASDGEVECEPSVVNLTVRTAPPLPESKMVCAMEGVTLECPVNYTGGGGFTYSLQASSPAHGRLEVVTNVTDRSAWRFRYMPQSGFTGVDRFDWSLPWTTGRADESPKVVTYWLVVKPKGQTDWPQWRADEWRSGFTTMQLPPKLGLRWQRDLPPTPSPYTRRTAVNPYVDIDYCRPVQLGKRIFVPVTASDCLMACDTETGEGVWKFYASGVIHRPPVAFPRQDGRHLVVFGSDDGWIYALLAEDGTLAWKVHAAPNSRTAMGFGRLSSVWPVFASPVLSRGRIYAAAGYMPLFGLYAYCLEAETGKALWTNDGRIRDAYNTSALGPLAVACDGARIYGSVEGACRPWVLDSANGSFLGHVGVGFAYPGVFRNGSSGWYTDGKGDIIEPGRADNNLAEPMSITVGSQSVGQADVRSLGVTGTVASILAGDGKLFVTTAQGGLYCFDGSGVTPRMHPVERIPLPETVDAWSADAKTMLSRADLKQGLALVFGLGCGRLAEELAKQSKLAIVVVDPDRAKLQAFRSRMDAAGLSGTRVSTLEGRPNDIAFAPRQAALIVSESLEVADFGDARWLLKKIHTMLRPQGGEAWLSVSEPDGAALATAMKELSARLPLMELGRCKAEGGSTEGFAQLKRLGLNEEMQRYEPPFGLAAFGSQPMLQEWSAPARTVNWPGRDTYSWLPFDGQWPDTTPPARSVAPTNGYPTPTTVSTAHSIFTTLKNPLSGEYERFPGLPASGADAACGAVINRTGDLGYSNGKLVSLFDASENYWGRLFLTGMGGCPGRARAQFGAFVAVGHPVSGSACGCSAVMQFSDMLLLSMPDEEFWVAYQTTRSGREVEDRPIRRVGVNFGAPGDRLVKEEGLLWTHHPFAGMFGQVSYSKPAVPEALPLVPVSYRGHVESIYHHSAQMDRHGERHRDWVAASYVRGMTGITLHLAQPAVALRAAGAPKIDGRLDEACWDGSRILHIVPPTPSLDPLRTRGPPPPDEECQALLRYDDQALYVAARVKAVCGPKGHKFVTVTLSNRDRLDRSVTLTCDMQGRRSSGVATNAWSGAGLTEAALPFAAEMAIPWKALEDAGLGRKQLVINLDISGGRLTSTYTPLFLDVPTGEIAASRTSKVRLYFAEMEGRTPGQRVFGVSLQGRRVIEALDIVTEAGGPKRELMKEFDNIVVGETLDIDFTPEVGEPLLSGVEVLDTAAPGGALSSLPPVAAASSTNANPSVRNLNLRNVSLWYEEK